jgi:hypothetical protein
VHVSRALRGGRVGQAKRRSICGHINQSKAARSGSKSWQYRDSIDTKIETPTRPAQLQAAGNQSFAMPHMHDRDEKATRAARVWQRAQPRVQIIFLSFLP